MQTVSEETKSLISQLTEIANNSKPALFEFSYHSGKGIWIVSFKIGVGNNPIKTVASSQSLRKCLFDVLDIVKNKWMLK